MDMHQVSSFHLFYIFSFGLPYYVFSGAYDRTVADSFPPTIYIDSLNSVVYFRYNRDGGVAVYKYDSNDIIVQVSMLSFDFWDEYDLEKLLYLGE